MKKALIICIILFLSSGIQAQIYWINDYESAKTLAKKSKKLIVMDFWASWCRPCLAMDDAIWNTGEMLAIAKNFIGLRINVDYDKRTASLYRVTGIPKVVIITASGELIWEKMGYSQPDDYLAVLNSIPENIGELNSKSVGPLEKQKDLQAFYASGIEFQRVGLIIKNIDLKNSFFSCSGKNFAKAKSLCKDPALIEEIGLYSILDDVYSGRHQKALKQIEKMDQNPKNEISAQLRHFILAKCYKNAGDKDNFQKEKQQIINKELISQLEN